MMCPEFNEEMKDVSTDSGAMSEENITSPENDTVAENDIISPESAEQVNEEQEPEVQDSESETDDAEVQETESADEPVDDATLVDDESAKQEENTEAAEEQEVIPEANNGNYLLFGGKDVPEGINYKDTLAFITGQLKYDGGELRQARENKDGSGIVNIEENATEICSYCGLPISGVDYYRLPDGRKRCTNCNRSLVKSVEELNEIFNEVVLNMELFFGATIDVPMSVEMLEERKLKKKLRSGLGNPPKNVVILGVAVEHKGKYTVYVENGIPRASLIATVAHELTHIWQYTHWNGKNIIKKYGAKLRLPVYEGMAKWTEIQYLYHIGEQTIAKREELLTLNRNDEYGIGFNLYVDQYPLKKETKAFIETPFSAGETPLGGTN